jgi:hypothetical protein
VAGWPVGDCDIKANSAQLELELGLSLAIFSCPMVTHCTNPARIPPPPPQNEGDK